jgi:hypothetical protein
MKSFDSIDELCSLILTKRNQLVKEFEEKGFDSFPKEETFLCNNSKIIIDLLKLVIIHTENTTYRKIIYKYFDDYKNNNLSSTIEFRAIYYLFEKLNSRNKYKKIIKREKPDFSYKTNEGVLIHTEIGEAIPLNWAQFRRLSNKSSNNNLDIEQTKRLSETKFKTYSSSFDIFELNGAKVMSPSLGLTDTNAIHSFIIDMINKKFIKYKTYDLGDINNILIYVNDIGFSDKYQAKAILNLINDSEDVQKSNITINSIFVANRQYDFFVEYIHNSNNQYLIKS